MVPEPAVRDIPPGHSDRPGWPWVRHRPPSDTSNVTTFIAIDDPGLARVLAVFLRDLIPCPVVVSPLTSFARAGDAAVVTPSDCDAVCAAELESRGVGVVVLAPVPRAEERTRYQAAGAEYLAMSMESNQLLVDALRRRLNQSAETDFRPAASQAVSPNCSA